MVAGATELVPDGKDSPAKSVSRGIRKARTDQTDQMEQQRFFLAKSAGSHGALELGKEFPGEAEAMVESLKTGMSYFVVSEWRGIADFSGRKPQLSRQAVRTALKTG